MNSKTLFKYGLAIGFCFGGFVATLVDMIIIKVCEKKEAKENEKIEKEVRELAEKYKNRVTVLFACNNGSDSAKDEMIRDLAKKYDVTIQQTLSIDKYLIYRAEGASQEKYEQFRKEVEGKLNQNIDLGKLECNSQLIKFLESYRQ